MTEEQELPAKMDVARALLLKGTVFVHLDPRGDGVCVPDWLMSQPQLVLQVGLEMPVPIPDLRVDEQGVFGTLSFNRQPFTCDVPWEHVFAVVGDDGRGMVWPESMPREIAAEVDREACRDDHLKPVPRNPAKDSSAGDVEAPLPGSLAAEVGRGIRDSRRPMAVHTDDGLPDGAFRVHPRAPESPQLRPAASGTGATPGGGHGSPVRRQGSQRPKGRVKLPPYMRVVK